MKKITTAIIVVLLILLCAGTAFAQGKIYEIPKLNLKVAIPEGYLVVTDETLDDPEVEQAFYDLYGMDAGDARELLEEQGLYMDALEIDGENEFMIAMTQDSAYDVLDNVPSINVKEIWLEDLRDSEAYADQQIVYFQSEDYSELLGGAEVLNVKKVSTDDALYISYRAIVELGGETYDELHYLTIRNGQYLDFILRDNSGGITPAHEQMMQGIIDSVQIESVENAVSRLNTANRIGIIVGVALAAVVALGAYAKYKARWKAEQKQVNSMAGIERDSILRNNTAERAKYLIGKLTVMRDEGVITQEEYERKVEEIGRRVYEAK